MLKTIRPVPLSLPLSLSCSLILLTSCGDSQNVSQDVELACSVQVDGDRNTGPDGIAETTKLRFFDASGKLERIESDTNGDGGMDEYTVLIYNALGQNIRSERRHLATDELLGEQEQSFDSEGRVVLQNEDWDADGFVETSTTRVYDDEGFRVIRINYSPFEKTIEETHYGPFGIEEFLSTTPSSDLIPTRRALYSYEEGRLKTVEEYLDDTLTTLTENVYNEAGHHLSSLVTRDDTSGLTTYSHDERGFINGWVYDENVDGTIDGSATCAANDEGQMISEEMDTDNDGTTDYLFHQSFDEQGRLIQEIEDDDGDHSSARRVVSYRYECE